MTLLYAECLQMGFAFSTFVYLLHCRILWCVHFHRPSTPLTTLVSCQCTICEMSRIVVVVVLVVVVVTSKWTYLCACKIIVIVVIVKSRMQKVTLTHDNGDSSAQVIIFYHRSFRSVSVVCPVRYNFFEPNLRPMNEHSSR